MLASAQDKDRIICKLQDAFLDGRLNESELEERVTHALVARTDADLASLVVDIPHQLMSSPTHLKSNSAIAIFSGIERNGQFSIPQNFRSIAVCGGCQLDLRSAIFTSPVTSLSVIAVLGGIEIILPRGLRVFLHQLPILGGISNKIISEDLPASAPSIHIKSLAVLGGIEVRTA